MSQNKVGCLSYVLIVPLFVLAFYMRYIGAERWEMQDILNVVLDAVWKDESDVRH